MTDAAEEQGLLNDIQAYPEDGASRLVYADWLEDKAGLIPGRDAQEMRDRAEFIRVQLGLEHNCDEYGSPLSSTAALDKLRQREKSLLEKHQEWLSPPYGATLMELRGGLPYHVTISAEKFLANAAELFGAAPTVTSVSIIGLRPEQIPSMVSSPYLEKLTVLRLGSNDLGDAGAVAIARSPCIRNLKTLTLSHNGIGDAGARAIAESPNVDKLTELVLWNNNVGEAGAAALAASPSLSKLRELDLGTNRIGSQGAIALANSPYLTKLTKLYLPSNGIGDPGGRALGDPAHLPNLEELDLGHNPIIRPVERVAVASIETRRQQRLGTSGA